jgi:pimeloyl-ACP methyl ester carboxylesterase
MIEHMFRLPRPEGGMEVFVAHPAGGGAWPVIILYMDMWGLRATLLDIARGIAAAGYCCVLPDLYYRRGKVRYAARDIPGLKLSFADLEPERQVALRAAMDGLSDAMVIDDTAALLDALSRDASVRHGPVGAIGYCMGGRHALCVAGTFPQRIKATACRRRLHYRRRQFAASLGPARRRRALLRPRGARPVRSTGRSRAAGAGAVGLPRPLSLARARRRRARLCHARPQRVRSEGYRAGLGNDFGNA